MRRPGSSSGRSVAERTRASSPTGTGSISWGERGSSGWVRDCGVRVTCVLRPTLLALLVFAAATASAQAYPWPVKPFHRQHAVGGIFGDPRMVFTRTLDENGLEGPGFFHFHNGVDIHVRAGTAVYPVTSGTVRLLSGSAV